MPSPRFPTSRVRRGARPLLLAALALAWAGCAGWPVSLGLEARPSLEMRSAASADLGQVMRMAPQGPGTVFATAEEAALDALAHCYLQTRQVRASMRRMRAGTIHPTAGGFTYDEPVAERLNGLRRLRYGMGPEDVAHFRHYPSRPPVPPTQRAIQREAREIVGRRDRAHRPLYTLSPERFVQVTSGKAAEHLVLARMERTFRRGGDDLALRMARRDALGSSDPVALQPRPGASAPR